MEKHDISIQILMIQLLRKFQHNWVKTENKHWLISMHAVGMTLLRPRGD